MLGPSDPSLLALTSRGAGKGILKIQAIRLFEENKCDVQLEF